MCEDRMIKDDEPVTWGDFATNLSQIALEMNEILERIDRLEKLIINKEKKNEGTTETIN